MDQYLCSQRCSNKAQRVDALPDHRVRVAGVEGLLWTSPEPQPPPHRGRVWSTLADNGARLTEAQVRRLRLVFLGVCMGGGGCTSRMQC